MLSQRRVEKKNHPSLMQSWFALGITQMHICRWTPSQVRSVGAKGSDGAIAGRCYRQSLFCKGVTDPRVRQLSTRKTTLLLPLLMTFLWHFVTASGFATPQSLPLVWKCACSPCHVSLAWASHSSCCFGHWHLHKSAQQRKPHGSVRLTKEPIL